jgi:hypothetical protein
MKTNIALIGLLIVFLSSCSSPKYLPSPDKIDVNEYGSYIELSYKTGSNIVGELIAIDNNEIIVLTEETRTCVTVPVNEVKQFILKYAKPKNYTWTIPVYTLATISHGYFFIFSAPVNLSMTILAASGEIAFTYSDKDMTYDKLKMFARFPQGIPANIDLTRIK